MKPKIVSIFSGVGGIDLGFEKAGFETVFASDICCEELIVRIGCAWLITKGAVTYERKFCCQRVIRCSRYYYLTMGGSPQTIPIRFII